MSRTDVRYPRVAPIGESLSEMTRRWLGTRRRWLIFVLILMVPFWIFFYAWDLRWDLLPYGAAILFSWYFGGLLVAYFLGPYLRHRHPSPEEYL